VSRRRHIADGDIGDHRSADRVELEDAAGFHRAIGNPPLIRLATGRFYNRQLDACLTGNWTLI